MGTQEEQTLGIVGCDIGLVVAEGEGRLGGWYIVPDWLLIVEAIYKVEGLRSNIIGLNRCLIDHEFVSRL